MRVPIVEDEPYLVEAVRDGLRLELLSVNSTDPAVLDRDIPGPSGDEIARCIVASGGGVPILMLTGAGRAGEDGG